MGGGGLGAAFDPGDNPGNGLTADAVEFRTLPAQLGEPVGAAGEQRDDEQDAIVQGMHDGCRFAQVRGVEGPLGAS